jgi:hypothetical protein
MAAPRRIRWAEVEYQPDLIHPAAPVPLGLVLEEQRGLWREVLIVGRVPKGLPPELNLEGTWGPFRDTVASWVTIFGKNVDAFFRSEPSSKENATDMLAREWHSNLYVKEPQSAVMPATKSLEAIARRLYEKYVGEPLLVDLRPRRARPRRRVPWVNQRLQAIA